MDNDDKLPETPLQRCKREGAERDVLKAACDWYAAVETVGSDRLVPNEEAHLLATARALPPKEVRTPDAEGWWARCDDGKVKWFRVSMTSDSGPCIYVSDLHDLVPVRKFSTPLTRWFGPITIPKEE